MMTDRIEDGIMKVLMLGSFQIDYKGITITSSDIIGKQHHGK